MLQKSFIALGLASLITIASMDAMADGRRMVKKSSHKSSVKSKFFKGDNYVGLSVGLDQNYALKKNSDIPSKPNPIAIGGVSFEKEFFNRLRFGVAYNYASKSKVRVPGNVGSYKWGYQSHILLGTVSYDLLEKSDFMPFIHVGVGAAKNKSSKWEYVSPIAPDTSAWQAGKSKTNFAWKAGLGFRMQTAKNIETRFDYSYLDKGEIKSGATKYLTQDGTVDQENVTKKGLARSHVVTFGLAYKF